MYQRAIFCGLRHHRDLDQRVLGDTLGATVDKVFPFPNLIAQAEQSQQSSAMVLINGQLYQLVLVNYGDFASADDAETFGARDDGGGD